MIEPGFKETALRRRESLATAQSTNLIGDVRSDLRRRVVPLTFYLVVFLQTLALQFQLVRFARRRPIEGFVGFARFRRLRRSHDPVGHLIRLLFLSISGLADRKLKLRR